MLLIRTFIRDFAIYGVGDLIVRASGFISLPLYTRLLDLSEYGTWSLLITAVGFVSALLILGGDSAYARLYFQAKTLSEKQAISSTWLIFLSTWTIGITLLCLPFSEMLGQWALEKSNQGVLVAIASLIAPFTIINAMCAQVLRNQFASRNFVLWNTVSSLLTISFSLIGLIMFNLGVAGILGGALAAAVLMLPLRLWTVRSMIRPVFSWRVLRELLAYGIPFVPSSIAYWVFISSDRFVLSKLSTLEQIGLYAVASQFASILGMVNNALGQAWSPYATLLYETSQIEAAVIFGRMMTAFLILFGLLAVGITTFSKEITSIFVDPQYFGASIAVGPLTIGFVAYASTQITAISISMTKRTGYFALYAWLTAILNLALNVIFVPRYGMIAASWSTAISYIVLTGCYFMVSQRLWRIQYEMRRVVIAILLILTFVISAPLLPSAAVVPLIIIKLAYIALFSVLLFVLKVIDRDHLQELFALIKPSKATTAP